MIFYIFDFGLTKTSWVRRRRDDYVPMVGSISKKPDTFCLIKYFKQERTDHRFLGYDRWLIITPLYQYGTRKR